MDRLQPSLPRAWRQHIPRLLLGSVVLWLLLTVALSYSKLPAMADKMRALSPLSLLEPGQERIVKYLQAKKTKGKIILDHNPTWAELEISFYSLLPDGRFIDNVRKPGDLITSIKHYQPEYIVLLPQGKLSGMLDRKTLEFVTKECGIHLRLIFDEAGYRLYSLYYIYK